MILCELLKICVAFGAGSGYYIGISDEGDGWRGIFYNKPRKAVWENDYAGDAGKGLEKDYFVISLDFQPLGSASFQDENKFSLAFLWIF